MVLMRLAVLAPVMILALACSPSLGAEETTAEACEPSRAVVDPLIGVEVRADGPDDVQGWALIFTNTVVQPGEEVALAANEELKIVWRLTGEGDISFRAIGPGGVVEQLTWGPDGPRGSNWDRPGQEWGTGWILPSGGCWTLEAERGQSVLSISIDAV